MYHTSTQHRTQDDTQESITIRLAREHDGPALARLAERDSARVPAGELLVALVGERMRAAVAIHSGETIADPFHPSEELRRLLIARSAQLRGASGRGRRPRLRLKLLPS